MVGHERSAVGDERVEVVEHDETATAEQEGSPGAPSGPRPRHDIATGRRPLTRTERRLLFAIVALAAVLRVLWLVFNTVEPPVGFGGDQHMYWYHANEIAAGRGYHAPASTEPTSFYPIGYPAIIAGLIWVASRVPLVDPDLMFVLGAFQTVVSIATVPLTFVVGRRLLGPRAGLVAAGVMASFPNLVYQVTGIQLETTFVFFTMAALAIIVDHDWSSGPPSRNRLLAFGAVLAISALVRPFSTPLLVGLVLALVAVGAGWRRVLAATLVPVGVLVVAFTPWTIRNAVQLDAFVPSSTNMGDTLCMDRYDGATGGFRFPYHEGCVDPSLPEPERNRGNTAKAIEFVVENPGRELLQVVRRAKLMFAEDNDGIQAVETLGSGPIFSDGTRTLLEESADVYFYVVVAAAIVGLPLLVRRSPAPERWLAVTIMAALLVIPLLLWGNPRFHLPLTPFLALSAAALTTWRSPPGAEPAAPASAAAADGDE